MKRSARLLCLLLVLGAAACGSRDPLDQARKLEGLGRYPSAIEKYEKFLRKYPDSQRVPEVLYRLGRIYQDVLKDYPKARAYYASIQTSYSGGPWAARARAAAAVCPDYFPLAREIVLWSGDSQSGGRHMRMEERILPQSPGRARLIRKVYAGQALIGTFVFSYEKRDGKLFERAEQGGEAALVLLYPPEEGASWETVRDGRKAVVSVEADDVSVSVRAGTFDNCLKLRCQFPGSRSWKLEYYAPNQGLILTSLATPQKETRISELLSVAAARREESIPPSKNQEKKP